MFWNASGGVRRYICAKRQWALSHTQWRHTIASPIEDELCQLKVPSLPLPGSAGAYRVPWQRAASARLLMEARPDIIESGDPYGLAWAALDAAQSLGVPAVAFCHSNLEQLAIMAAGPHWQGLAGRAARRYTLHLYRQFQLVLAPSRGMASHLRQWGIANATHQPLGVDSEVFHPRHRSAQWRASLRLPTNARLLIYTGRFAPEKNLDTLVSAVRRLGPDYWLLAVGSGMAAPSGDRVIVWPQISEPADLARVLASADLYVHAGAQETFGLAVLEALASGLPVVARGAEGLAELVDDSVGQAVALASVDHFAEAIASVFDRDMAALGKAARTRALAYEWKQVLPQLWRHYRQVMKGSPVLDPQS